MRGWQKARQARKSISESLFPNSSSDSPGVHFDALEPRLMLSGNDPLGDLPVAAYNGPWEWEFSVDIGSDAELSDPVFWGNEAFDPGDIYLSSSGPVQPPGRDGYRDDDPMHGWDVWPDPPDPNIPPMTAVPVGMGDPSMYMDYFDVDGHDSLDFELWPILPWDQPLSMPEPWFPTQTVHEAMYLAISYDDDGPDGWPMWDVPTTTPSWNWMTYGTTAGQDEVIAVTLSGGPMPQMVMNVSPLADEATVHPDLAPNPDAMEEEDDDVDSLDILDDPGSALSWLFSADHEADAGWPRGIYESWSNGPGGLVIDPAIHLGLDPWTDIDAFEIVWLDDMEFGQGLVLGIVFSVDVDDPMTGPDESGFLDPTMLYASYFTGYWFELTDMPLDDDIDAITNWYQPFDEEPPPIDWGDAPDPMYPTLDMNLGASHMIISGYHLGAGVDGEWDGQPDTHALGDDNAGMDDEDGVVFSTPLVPGGVGFVDITASGVGYIDMWIDFDGDGSWYEPGDDVLTGMPITAAGNVWMFPVPPTAATGIETFARVRFSSIGYLPPDGPADDGEVEDHLVIIEALDWGDAPDPYPTLSAAGGAAHVIAGPWLGGMSNGPDAETDGQPTPAADGDDTDGNDDEGGVTIPTLVLGQSADLEIKVRGGGGEVEGFIDFDRDGVWLPHEWFSFGWLPNGTHTVPISVPLLVMPGPTYARFRISTQGSLGFDGLALDGEVEDYAVTIQMPTQVDWGDAPDPTYPTLAASNGASHTIVPGYYLGTGIDGDFDGQPDANALGDDNDGSDDEDGLTFALPLVPGEQTRADITVSGPGFIDMWIDYDGDGGWAEPDDYVFQGRPISAPEGLWWFTPPLSAAAGIDTFARIRFSSIGNLPYDGPADDGEVEDYRIHIESVDWGDAPDGGGTGFPTYMASGGASHMISGPYLGNLGDQPDGEVDGQPNATASGDDSAGSDDENGITFATMIAGQSSDVQVRVSAGGGYVNGWIDFDGDGSWAGTEQIINGFMLGGMTTLSIPVPAAAAIGTAYARFRIASTGPNGVGGFVTDGEVEDYAVTIEPPPPDLDFGDAPDPTYPTLLASNGARHIINPAVYLGASVDADAGGQPGPAALGDDNDGNDDEDGVVFTSAVAAGAIATLDVTASMAGLLDAWIDFNADGDWADSGEQIFSSEALVAGVNPLAFSVPNAAAFSTDTVGRFRFSTVGGLAVTGEAPDGEVEDHLLHLADADMGDAFDLGGGVGFPTLLASGGAVHILGTPLWLGSSVDAEPDGQPDITATGDDNDGSDDEDGVTFDAPLTVGTQAQITVTATENGRLQGWVDFDGDLTWSAGEQVFTDEPVLAGTNTLMITVPAGATLGQSYARFRLATASGVGVGGIAVDGEVEDYAVYIEPDVGDVKWDQPPEPGTPDNVFYGWNEESVYGGTQIAADDWFCDTPDAVSSITWWGSFLDWTDTDPTSVLPNSFHLGIWTDVPAGTDAPHSHPGDMIWEVDTADVQVQWVGWDYDPISGSYEACYRFDVALPEAEWFIQDPAANSIYWLSVAATYQTAPSMSQFGWKTRQRDPSSTAPDAAVVILDPVLPALSDTVTDSAPIEWPIGEQWDLAFELGTSVAAAVVWDQQPELPDGTDVLSGLQNYELEWYETYLADDFQWNGPLGSPLTDITIWGSYKNDTRIGAPPWFDLAIYADIPASQSPTGYSMPAEVLWSGSLWGTESLYTAAAEGFYDPVLDMVTGSDTEIWQYDFQLPPGAFIPVPGTVYWLGAHHSMDLNSDGAVTFSDIMLLKTSDWAFGWKTSMDQWNDAAVYTEVNSWLYGGDTLPPPNGPWLDMDYPAGHTLADQRMDLSFEVGSFSLMYWSQDPDESSDGLDVLAAGTMDPLQRVEIYLADDFLSSGTDPIIEINVFGSLLEDMASPLVVDYFNLAIFEDIPAGTGGINYSRPGAVLWSTYQAPDATSPFAGANDDFYDPSHNLILGNDWQVMQYTFQFDTASAFVPEADTIYWLAVNHSADIMGDGFVDPMDDNAQLAFPWAYGWHSADGQWNDDATWVIVNTTGTTGEIAPVTDQWRELYHPGTSDSMDLAFTLTQAGSTGLKWSQPPEPYVPTDAFNGWDESSVYGDGKIVADDWFCTTSEPVTDVHWWGSFIGWPDTDPPQAQLPDAFQIGIWTDVPAGVDEDWSHPGVMIWENYCTSYTMTFAGWDFSPAAPIAAPEPVFLFEQYLDEADWFYQDPGDNVYWISIAAVYDTGTPTNLWGWTTRPRDPASPAPDDAVRIYEPESPILGSQFATGEPIFYPTEADSWDMAFRLTTAEPPERDFGDAPDGPYPTLKASNGAAHTIVPGIYMGATIDTDLDGQPNAAATGDDSDGTDDEDGVVFTSLLIPGTTATVDVTASVDGYLDAWIDFSGDGSWAGDQIFISEPVTAGLNSLSFSVPAGGSLVGVDTFARFRFSTAGGLGYADIALDGEVEDHAVHIEPDPPAADLGDAPDSTNSNGGTMYAYPGVVAQFPTVYGIGSPEYGPVHWHPEDVAYLGDAVSFENEADLGPDADGVTNLDSTADLADRDDADDGLVLPLTLTHGQPSIFDYTVTQVGPAEPLYLNAWFDWTRDGDWDDSFGASEEWAVQNELVTIGTPGTYTFTSPDFIPYHPGGLEEDDNPLWVRITLSERQFVDTGDPGHGGSGTGGGHQFGESEDYLITTYDQTDYDYGDAPDGAYGTYPTIDGAAHQIVSGWYLGSGVDADANGQPDATATGDDNDGNDDEDGVTFKNQIIPGDFLVFEVVASQQGRLDVWIDYNADGDWDDPGEYAVPNYGVSTWTEYGIVVPDTALYGVDTFARFRFSSVGGLSVDGVASDGEVEDYAISSVKADFGDAPSSYPTLRGDGGAIHLVRGGLYLGAARDGESDGQPSAAADLDDTTGVDDEDGVSFDSALVAGSTAQITVTASAAGILQGWIDFNADGDWADTGEQVMVNIPVVAGANSFNVWIPPTAATGGTTYARFRLASAAGVGVGGIADDGEVEDYALTIDAPDPMYKWQQPPAPGEIYNAYYGWNEPSIYDATHMDALQIAADDWYCDSADPVTSITWWGSFLGWNGDLLPPSQPLAYQLGIWTDVPAGIDQPWSHPGQMIWEYGALNPDIDWVGWDYDPRSEDYESCYRFSVDLPQDEWFNQDPQSNSVYWLSISAVYLPGMMPPESFGWKTVPRDPASTAPDAAVVISDPDGPMVGSQFVAGAPLEWPAGSQWDLAFELGSQTPDVVTWEQTPDMDMDTGLDVLDGPMGNTRKWYETFLADDFQFDQGGPVTDITIYGTYLEDNRIGAPLEFNLVIYEDIPAAQSPTGYSMPGAPVWGRFATPLSEVPYAAAVESFYDPDGGVIRGQETEIWQYYFNIPELEAFTAEAGEVYWLGVHHSMDMDNDGDVDLDDVLLVKSTNWAFAWKTSGDHWNDAAAWSTVSSFGVGPEVYAMGPWDDLTYPSGHPLVNDPIDLAFTLGSYSSTQWHQAPDLTPDGLGVLAGPSDEPRTHFETFLADDFLATDDSPIIQIDVWGSYLNDVMFPLNDEYNVAIYEYIDQWASPTGYAIPGAVLWSAYQSPDVDVFVTNVPSDEFYNPVRNAIEGLDWSIYKRSFKFSEAAAFTPTAGTPYFLGVSHTADVDGDGNVNLSDMGFIEALGWAYGWHNSDIHTGGTAVWTDADSMGTTGENYPETNDWWTLVDPRNDSDLDLAFALTTPGDPYVKWSQPPEPYMPTDAFEGWDEPSVYGGSQIVAADWMCSAAEPVTDVHFWGSFVDWSNSTPAQLPDEFHLAIWTDVPAGALPASQPGVVVWEALADTYTSQFVGWDNTPLDPSTAPEAVFYFEYDLPEEEWFWQESPDTVYWLSIDAVYNTPPGANEWGWLTRPWDPASAAPGVAMVILDPNEPTVGSTFVTGDPLYNPTTGDTWDMAFELTTRGDATRDFGDSADPAFPTLLVNDGARHTIVPGLHLGAAIDTEIEGQPTAAADGDDTNGIDDEDGVVFPSLLIPAMTATVDVTVTTSIVNPIYLNAWIDFNNDGDWDDAGESILAASAVGAGVNSLSFAVPAAAATGADVAARFRLSTVAMLGYDGWATNGEVEDHLAPIADMDFGDANDTSPSDYATLLANDGARHVLDGGLYLGVSIDGEPDGQPTPGALGDDLLDGSDDEDGVFFTGWLLQGLTASMDVIASAPGFLDVWIDFDQSGQWDQPNEAVFVALPVVAGVNTLTFPVPVTDPGDAYSTTARFRISDTGGLATTGMAIGGEVEDYLVQIHTPGEIYGLKFWDVDADGVQQPGEPGLQGWIIFLDGNEDEKRDPDEPYTTTDANGEYSFGDLPPGAYTVAEERQTHWTQTAPVGGSYAVPISSGVISEDNDFGNWMTGDFDFDQDVDDNDIDMLGIVKTSGPYDPLYDLDGDVDVDPADLAELLTHVFVNDDMDTRGIRPGDTDLDGDVDLDDFVAMKLNFGTGTKWREGDVDADGDVDLDDFSILKNNFGKGAVASAIGVISEMRAADSDAGAPSPIDQPTGARPAPRRMTRRRPVWGNPASHYAPTVSLEYGSVISVLSRRRPRLIGSADRPAPQVDGDVLTDILSRVLPVT